MKTLRCATVLLLLCASAQAATTIPAGLGKVAQAGPGTLLDLGAGEIAQAGPGHAVVAEPGLRQGLWLTFGMADGLMGLGGLGLVEDRSGHLWIGTETGLTRYDGRTFTRFTSADGLSADFIYRIIEDRDGHLWFGSSDGGLTRYDGHTFTRFTAEHGLPAASVVGLYEDRDGHIWFSCTESDFLGDYGAIRYDGKTFTHFTSEDGLPPGTVMSIAQDRAGQMWFGINDQGAGRIARYDGQNFTTFEADDLPLNNAVMSVLQDRRGRMWFGTYGDGLFRYDGDSFTHYTPEDGLSKRGNAMSLYQDSTGRIWVGSQGFGISYADGDADEPVFKTFTKEHGLSDGHIYAMLEDRAGQMWFKTLGSGLMRYDGGRVQHFTQLKNGAALQYAFALIEDEQGLLVGGNLALRHGLARYDGKNFVGIDATGIVQDIATDAQGAVWLALRDGALARYDGQKVVPIRDEALADTTFGGEWTDTRGRIAVDGQNRLWVGGQRESGEGNLVRRDGQRWTRIDDKGQLSSSVGNFFEDDWGRMWFTSNSQAFYCEADSVVQFKGGAVGEKFKRVFQDSRGTFYFVTTSGIYRYDGQTWEQIQDQGIAGGWVLSIVEDGDGRLYFARYGGGLQVYDGQVLQTLTRRNYLSSDGLQSLYIDRAGDLWVGSDGGVSRYRRTQVPPQAELLQITADRSYGTASSIALPSTQHLLIFELGARSLSNPDGMAYVYRLLGRDDSWQTSYQPRVEFRDLPSGDYTFEFKAVDRDLNYSEPVQVAVRIHPPYERYALIAGLVAALGLVAYQTQRVVRRDQRLQENNRRLVIEHAVERVRAEALSMRESKDISKLVAALRQALYEMGIKSDVNVSFIDEDHIDHIDSYLAGGNPRAYGLEPDLERTEEINEAVMVTRTVQTLDDWNAYRLRDEEHQRKLHAYRSGEIASCEVHIDRELARELIQKYVPFQGSLPDEVFEKTFASLGGDWVITYVPFSHGLVGYRERTYSEEHAAIVQKLAEALSVGYLRFLDFQKVEEQNRVLAEARDAAEIARSAAEAANRAKSLFLANMSHEIRTPMNAILGYAQIMQRRDLPAALREPVETIQNSGQHLLRLINEVLDLSKIEAGRMELNPVDFDLGKSLDDLSAMFALRCQEKNLAWSLDKSGGELQVRGDEAKLSQVLINLLGNAVKFTEAGHVELNVQQEGERFHFEAVDSGQGIARESLARIFDPFEQGEGGQREGGTGLGLAISQRILALMGSELEVDSALGEGSRFAFSVVLPAASGAISTADEVRWQHVKRLAPGQTLDVLVVDDVVENRQVLAALLGDIGAEVRQAASGMEGLQVLAERLPDIALLDMRMPGMSGGELAQQIWDKYGRDALSVVAISASTLDHERQGYLDQGFDDFLDKPVRASQIFGCLAQLLNVEYEYGKSAPVREKETADFGAVALPDELLARLNEAAATSNMTRLMQGLDEVEALGAEERELATHLRALVQDFALAEVAEVLAQVGAKGESA